MEEMEGYYKATRDNLVRAFKDLSGVQDMTDETATLKVERVLDIGCGIGQALFPLAIRNGAFGIGIDISDQGLRVGRKVYDEYFPEAQIEFIRSSAEALPFASKSFDVINFGLALPYTDNLQAIGEVARTLRDEGIFLLKIHHTRYYTRELWRGLTKGDLSSVIHGARVLVAGTLYHSTRKQPRVKLLNETYQTKWLLKRELAKHGMFIERMQKNTNPLTPAFIIRKTQKKIQNK